MHDAFLAALNAELDGGVITDADVVAANSRDHAPVGEAGQASCLVRARSRDDVVAVLRLANDHRISVVPQGARTGLSSGANAVADCVLLDVSRMNQILRIDPTDRLAVVQPGVINATLSAEVLKHGLFYPPDPASWEISSIGGNVATNAGGLCCVKYGVTRQFVRSLEVVLADGSVIRTGTPTRKGVAGYDLTGLFVGSEGTLGVITEITVGLIPAPDAELVAVALFTSATQACRAAARYLEAGGRPSKLEFMDGPTLKLVQRIADVGIGDEVDGMLIMAVDDASRTNAEFTAFQGVCEAAGAEVFTADDAQEAEQLMQARRLVGPAHEAAGLDLVDDVCVPIARAAEVIEGTREIGRRHQVYVTVAAHLGDGNMHPTVLYSRDDDAQAARARAAFDDIMRLGLEVGGTITGEHGVGRLKASLLGEELGARQLELQRSLKATFDPAGILNPGVMFTR